MGLCGTVFDADARRRSATDLLVAVLVQCREVFGPDRGTLALFAERISGLAGRLPATAPLARRALFGLLIAGRG